MLNVTAENLHVGNCFGPNFDRYMINNLVMDETRVSTLKALAKSFIRVNKNEEQSIKNPGPRTLCRERETA